MMPKFIDKIAAKKEACLSSLEKLQDIEQALDYLEMKGTEVVRILRHSFHVKLGIIVEAQENGAK